MKGLIDVAEASKHGQVPLYYSPMENRVSVTQDNESYFKLTELIRENTTKEIEDAVRYFMSL